MKKFFSTAQEVRKTESSESPSQQTSESLQEEDASSSAEVAGRIHGFRELRNRLTHLDEYVAPFSNNTALLLRANDPVDFLLRKQKLTRQIRSACFEEMRLVKNTVNNLIEEQKKRDERPVFERNQVINGRPD